MGSIIAEIVERFVATLVLTVVVLVLLVWLLQRRRNADTWSGIFRTLGAMLSGPIHYVRDTLDELAKRSSTGIPGPRGDAEMLIKRLLFSLNLLIALVGLTIVSAGLIRGWYAMVPPGAIVAQYKSALTEKARLDSIIPQRQGFVYRLDSIWKSDSAKWVAAYEDTLKTRVSTATTQRTGIRRELGSRPSVAAQQYAQRMNELDAAPIGSDEYWADRFRNSVRVLMTNMQGLSAETVQGYGITPRDTAVLWRYLAAWVAGRTAEDGLRRWPPRGVRSQLQQEYDATRADIERSTQRSQNLSSEIAMLKPLTAWHPVLFAIDVVKAVLAAFLLVWIAGATLEVSELAFKAKVAQKDYFSRAAAGVAAPPNAYSSAPPPAAAKPSVP